MRVVFIFFFALILFGCSSDDQVDFKAVHCGLLNCDINSEKSVLVIHEGNTPEKLNDLSWEFTFSNNFDDILLLKPVSLVLVSTSYIDSLYDLPESIKNQFSFLFQTEDFIALKKSNKLEYTMNFSTTPPLYIQFNSKNVVKKSTKKGHLVIKNNEPFPFLLAQKIKTLPEFKTHQIFFHSVIKSLDLKDLSLVINIKTQDGKVLYYEPRKLNTANKDSLIISQFSIDLPAFVSGEDIFEMYIFNAQKGNYLLQSLDLDFTPKIIGNDRFVGPIAYQFNNDFKAYKTKSNWAKCFRVVKGRNFILSKASAKSYGHFSDYIENMNLVGNETILFSAEFKAENKDEEVRINYIIESGATDTIFYHQEKLTVDIDWHNYSFSIPMDCDLEKNSRFRFWIEYENKGVACDNIISSFITNTNNCN